MSETPFMPLWVSDFLGDTLDLDAKEIGAYMLLLMAMWQHGGALPADEKKLRRVARIGRDWPKVWASLERFFTVDDGLLKNNRLTLELQKVDAKRRVNARSGARGGRANALKNKDRGLANAQATITIPIKQENAPPISPPEKEADGNATRETRRSEAEDDGQGGGVASAPRHDAEAERTRTGEPGSDRQHTWQDFRLTPARRSIAIGCGVSASDIEGQHAAFIAQQETTAAMVRGEDEAWRRHCIRVGRHRSSGSAQVGGRSATSRAFGAALARMQEKPMDMEPGNGADDDWLTASTDCKDAGSGSPDRSAMCRVAGGKGPD